MGLPSRRLGALGTDTVLILASPKWASWLYLVHRVGEGKLHRSFSPGVSQGRRGAGGKAVHGAGVGGVLGQEASGLWPTRPPLGSPWFPPGEGSRRENPREKGRLWAQPSERVHKSLSVIWGLSSLACCGKPPPTTLVRVQEG